jgi:hypothetical protein
LKPELKTRVGDYDPIVPIEAGQRFMRIFWRSVVEKGTPCSFYPHGGPVLSGFDGSVR